MESNHSGRLSHVASQSAMIPSSRSMLSRDKRLPFDTWNALGLQENFFGNQVSTFDSYQNHHQGIHHHTTPGVTGSIPVHTGTGTPVARDEDQHWGTIAMPTFPRKSSTMSSFIAVAIPQNSVAGQQRLQMSELQFDKFPTPSSFMYLKIRFKTQVSSCADFPFRCYVSGSKKWRFSIQWMN